MSDVVKKERATTKKETSVDGAENKSPKTRKVLITLDSSIKEVVEYSEADDVVMVFDHQSFLELPEEVVKDLPYQSRNNYFMARGARMAAKNAPIRKERKLIDPLADAVLIRHRQIEAKHWDENDRRYYHQAWIDPKYVDGFKTMGYRNVRKNNDGEDDPSGNIVQMMNGDKIEAVALEIPWEVYEDHMHAMSEKSQNLYSSAKESAKASAQDRYRVQVLDDEDPDESEYMNWLVKQMERSSG